MPDTPEIILAFDYGARRIGVAVGQQITSSASPLTVITNNAHPSVLAAISNLIEEWRPARLIVGMPSNTDGTPAPIGDAVKSFISELEQFSLPVNSVDERYTSLEAENLLKAQRQSGQQGRISKEKIDSTAAVLIAERWLKKEF